jgi:hypothetical protein
VAPGAGVRRRLPHQDRDHKDTQDGGSRRLAASPGKRAKVTCRTLARAK